MACSTTCVEMHETFRLKPFKLDVEKENEDIMCELEYAQSLPGSSIDSRKLMALLRVKFGTGAYDVHVGCFADWAGFVNLPLTLCASGIA